MKEQDMKMHEVVLTITLPVLVEEMAESSVVAFTHAVAHMEQRLSEIVNVKNCRKDGSLKSLDLGPVKVGSTIAGYNGSEDGTPYVRAVCCRTAQDGYVVDCIPICQLCERNRPGEG